MRSVLRLQHRDGKEPPPSKFFVMSGSPLITQPRQPIAFISHSSEDKERFVRRLETGLRSKGVRTIYDERDFHLGDSLPDAMFEHGVGIATVNVLVLSRTSLESKFVKAERDLAVMRRIEEDVPILVLVLDGLGATEIPMSLRALIRHDVDLTSEASIEAAIQRTADAAHMRRIAQDVGQEPAWAQAPRVMVTNDPVDGAMLGVAARAKLKDETNLHVNRDRFFEEAARIGRSQEDAEESLKILDGRGLLESFDWYGAGKVARHYGATRDGLDSWLKATDPKYEEKLRVIGASMVNDACRFNYQIETATGFDRAFVSHALDILEARGLAEVRRGARGGTRSVTPTALLRRWLNQ